MAGENSINYIDIAGRSGLTVSAKLYAGTTLQATVALSEAPASSGRYSNASAPGVTSKICDVKILEGSNVLATGQIAYDAAGNEIAQTGDTFARVGTAGAGLTAIGDTRIAAVYAKLPSKAYLAGTDTATGDINGGTVRGVITYFDQNLNDFVNFPDGLTRVVVGDTGAINANATLIAGAAPGQYIGSAVWDYLTSAAMTAGSMGKRIVDFVTTLVYSAPLTAQQTADAMKLAPTTGAAADGSVMDRLGDLSTQVAEKVTVVVTPLVAAVTNPRFATRAMAAIAAGSESQDAWTITDAAGAAVDLSTKDLLFVAYRITDAGADPVSPLDDSVAPAFTYATGGGGITVGGTSNNVVTVQHNRLKTATAGDYSYWLLNATDRIPLAQGKLPIKPCTWSAV